MCRLAAYAGPAIPIRNIVSVPAHSLLQQSLAAKETAFTVNGDGFGVSWYGDDHIPGQFRDIMPAWGDQNLNSICRLVQSRLFLAHIRASTNGETSRANCHPFVYDRWSYMHNGQIPHIQRLRRELEYELSDDLFNARCGTTDSELFFLYLLSNGFATQQSPTLYLTDNMQQGGVSIASEPLDPNSSNWSEVPENSLCIIENGRHQFHGIAS